MIKWSIVWRLLGYFYMSMCMLCVVLTHDGHNFQWSIVWFLVLVLVSIRFLHIANVAEELDRDLGSD